MIVFSAASYAWASGPGAPAREMELRVPAVSNPSAVSVFVVQGDEEFVLDELEASLSLDGEEVSGSLEVVWSRPGSFFLAFVPDEPLQLGQRYTLDLEDPRSIQGSFDIDIVEAALPTLGDLQPSWDRKWSNSNCCSTTAGCRRNSLGTCTVCWPMGFVYGPSLLADAEAVQSGVLAEWSLKINGQERSGTELLDGERPGLAANFVSVGTDFEEACLEVELLDSLGQSVTETQCLQREEFPAVPQEEPDARDEISMCAEEPDNTEDPQWQRHKGLSQVGGCTTSGGEPGFLVVLLSLVGFVYLKRREFGPSTLGA